MPNFDFLLEGMPKNYPHVIKSPQRIQIQFDDSTWGMLIQHQSNSFWCGYCLVNREEMQMLETKRPLLGISYCAPANRPISWMTKTGDGRLTKPTQLLDSPGGDFWVGTHFDPSVNAGMAQAYLSQFCARINEAILYDSSVRGQAGDYAGV